MLVAIGSVYFLIYVLTPKPLVWHVQTSVERLMMHLLPRKNVRPSGASWTHTRFRTL